MRRKRQTAGAKKTYGNVQGSLGPVRIISGTILAVDRETYTASVTYGDPASVIEGVEIGPLYIGSNGQGVYYMPEVGATVWLCTPSERNIPFILAGCAPPLRRTEDQQTADSMVPNYRMNRPILNEGDIMLSSQDGNFVAVRRGGVVEIGASQLAQRLFIPGENLLRDLCQAFDLITAGGRLQWKDRTEDETWGEDKTPTEFTLEIKEFAEDAPVIEIKAGRIKDEDDTRLAGGDSNVVARLKIGDNLTYWIDKNGIVNSTRFAPQIDAYNAPATTFHAQGKVEEIKGLLTQIASRKHQVVNSNYTKEVRGNYKRRVDKNLSEEVAGDVSRVTGPVTEEVKGDIDRSVAGTVREDLTGNVEQSIAGGRVVGIGGSDDVVVVGNKRIFVIGLDGGTAYQLMVAQNELSIHNIAGDVKLTCGGSPDINTAEIFLNNLGSVHLRSPSLTGVEVEVNETGVRISSTAGEISLDQVGTVLLGPAGRAGVVTTLTHPTDYVTGLPILGSISVQAGGAPVPVGTELPSTFVSKTVL